MTKIKLSDLPCKPLENWPKSSAAMYTSKSRNSRVAKNSFNNVHKPTNLMLVVVFTVVMLVLTSRTILNEDAQEEISVLCCMQLR